MSLLTVTNLGKRFQSRNQKGDEAESVVIDSITFSVEEGEFLTIVGPSGSGKSTLLNLIAQIDAPSSGQIQFSGRKLVGDGIKKLDPGINRQIGYVTQDDTLLPWRTTIENVLLPLKLADKIDDEQRKAATELMSAVGLTGYENHYPHELSGGMRKRAALIRTLVYDPPVILMDEPFGALDAQTRLQLQSDLLDLWERRRKTIIFVTHDIGEAISLGDRTLVLSRQPTRVAGDHVIPFPRPRDLMNAMAWPGYSEVHEKVRSQVR